MALAAAGKAPLPERVQATGAALGSLLLLPGPDDHIVAGREAHRDPLADIAGSPNDSNLHLIHQAGEHGLKGLGTGDTFKAVHHLPVLLDDQGRDHPDAVFVCHLHVLVDIDLPDVHPVAHLLLQLLEDRPLPPARPAPVSIKVE